MRPCWRYVTEDFVGMGSSYEIQKPQNVTKFKHIPVCGIQQLGIDSISHALVNTKLSSRKKRAFQKGYKRREEKF